MLELAVEILAGRDAYVVGGTVRDELLGRSVLDLDIACAEPEQTARAYADRAGGAPFPLSATHGGWRVALDNERTVDFTPLRGSIEDDLATRDFTINAIARPLAGGEHVDPFGGRADLDGRTIRAVNAGVFEADPLRLLRAVRFEEELGFAIERRTERLIREQAKLVTKPAGERTLEVLGRLGVAGWHRLDDLGLLAPLGGSLELAGRADAVDSPDYRLAVFLRDSLGLLPISRELRRYAVALLRSSPPADASPRVAAPLPSPDRAVGARGARVPRPARPRARARAVAGRRSAGAAAARRRARAAPGAGDRGAAGADRRGTRGRHDLDQRGGAGACPTTFTLRP